MNSKLLVGMFFTVIVFLVTACAPGVSQAEYDAVKKELNVAVTELNKIKSELETTRTELNKIKSELETTRTELHMERAKIKEYETKIAKAHAYAEVYDVSADPYRMELKVATKYGWLGPGKSPDYIATFKSKTEATGDAKLKEMVDRAFGLPWGDEKTKAWYEVWLYWAERLLAVTKP